MKKFILTASLLIGTFTAQAQDVISSYNCTLYNTNTRAVIKTVQFSARGGVVAISTNPSNANSDMFMLDIFPREEMVFRVRKYSGSPRKIALQVDGSATSGFFITDGVGGYFFSCMIK